MSEVHQQPCIVAAEDGLVYVDGPGNIAFAMTSTAARLTADRLRESAAEAQRQSLAGGEQP